MTNRVNKMSTSHESLSQEPRLIGGADLASALLYPSGDAFRAAKHRGGIPVELFRVPGRKGWFARREDVFAWQQAQLPESDVLKLRTHGPSGGGMSFGQLIKAIRLQKQMSQKALAGVLEIDQSYLAAVESGRRKPPKPPQFGLLLDAICTSEAQRTLLAEAAEYFDLRRGAGQLNREDKLSIVKLIEMLPMLGTDEVRALYEHADGLLLRARRAQMT